MAPPIVPNVTVQISVPIVTWQYIMYIRLLAVDGIKSEPVGVQDISGNPPPLIMTTSTRKTY